LTDPLQSREAWLRQTATRLEMVELSSLSKKGILSGRLGLCRTTFFWKWRFWRINEVPQMVGYDPTLRNYLQIQSLFFCNLVAIFLALSLRDRTPFIIVNGMNVNQLHGGV